MTKQTTIVVIGSLRVKSMELLGVWIFRAKINAEPDQTERHHRQVVIEAFD